MAAKQLIEATEEKKDQKLGLIRESRRNRKATDWNSSSCMKGTLVLISRFLSYKQQTKMCKNEKRLLLKMVVTTEPVWNHTKYG